VPGYDRHFAITEHFGIEMINVPMTTEGPDMDMVEKLVAEDESIKGIWCVPKYSNPQGFSYSKETVRRFARLNPKASDFRIYWDNAYMIHDLVEKGDTLLDIFAVAREAGTEDRVMFYTSSSKITFPGAGVAIMAMSKNNLDQITPIWNSQTIGHDKLNQLRHLEFLPNEDAVYELMRRHADILRARFAIVQDTLARDLGDCGIAEWTKPNGGYFVSLDVYPDTARRVYELCRDAGVTLPAVGAPFPYRRDPENRNLRLAPSYPTRAELAEAVSVLTVAVRMAALEKLMA
jgi:DNA-binding transcriptional MocR family regulator